MRQRMTIATVASCSAIVVFVLSGLFAFTNLKEQVSNIAVEQRNMQEEAAKNDAWKIRIEAKIDKIIERNGR